MKSKSSIYPVSRNPVSRKLYHLLVELHSLTVRMEHLASEVEATEAEAHAERSRHAK